MPIRSLLRRLVGLAAAYAVAGQLLLLPLTVAAGAGFHGTLCTAGAVAAAADIALPGTSPGQGEQPSCLCAAGCGMQGGAPVVLPDIAGVRHVFAGYAAGFAALQGLAPVAESPAAHQARGPPVV